MLIHPGRNPQAPQEVLDVLAEAGGDVGRTIMGHLDRTLTETDDVLALAKSGCYLEYDLFGWETSYYPFSDIEMPNDGQRIGFIKFLVDHGYAERLVLAHDVFGKSGLAAWGGFGIAHILENIVPRLRERGISDQDVHSMTVANPARVLPFA